MISRLLFFLGTWSLVLEKYCFYHSWIWIFLTLLFFFLGTIPLGFYEICKPYSEAEPVDKSSERKIILFKVLRISLLVLACILFIISLYMGYTMLLTHFKF